MGHARWDEYEVARLHTNGDFLKRIESQFEGDYRLKMHLAPPLWARTDPVTGELRKREYGAWMLTAMRMLAPLRFLRGTAFDVFGYSAERRTERQLIGDYEGVVNELLDKLDPARVALAAEIAAIPEFIRGYGHVKERHLRDAKAREAQLLAQWRDPGATATRIPIRVAACAAPGGCVRRSRPKGSRLTASLGIPGEPARDASAGRLVSLDAFRGFTIASMVLVNNPGDWGHIYAPLKHAEWNGWTFTDLVFPFFLFAAGVSMAISVERRARSADDPPRLLRDIARRAAVIFLVGLALNLFPAFDFSTVRIPGVLQRIALCVLIAAPFAVHASSKAIVAGIVVLLMAYTLPMLFVPVSGPAPGMSWISCAVPVFRFTWTKALP